MHNSNSSDVTGLSQDALDELDRLLDEADLGDAGTSIVPRASGAPTPMSFSQELLWLLDRATPGLTAYNLPFVRRLRGHLDVAALERALHAVVARHEVLRTHFADEDGNLRQIIGETRTPLVHHVDLSGLDESAREREATSAVRERAMRPFDLSRDHLFRPTLIRLANDNHVLVIESHHIVLDGWSMGLVLREIAEHYAATNEGRAVAQRATVQFGDFAAWQRQQLAGPRLEELLTFWRGQLGNATEPLSLPTDFARAAVPTFAGARQTLTLTPAQLAGVRKLAAAHDATLYMALLAAYATVLHRYTGREDVLIGSGSAGRTMAETQSIVGYLNNTLVQHASFAGAPTFSTVLKHVRDSALGAYDHQDIPLEKLVLELRQGDARLAPLFEVVLTMQDTVSAAASLGSVAIEPFSVEFGATKFDITLLVAERGNELALTAQYRSDLFAPDTMRRFLGHVMQVLESAMQNSAVPIADIPMLTAAEREQLAAWNQTAVEEGAAASIVSLFETQAAMVPARTAVTGSDESMSYESLNARANQLAHHLTTLGVSANAPVGLLLDRSAGAIVALLGILKAGGAYVPLSVDAPASRIAAQLAECRANVVVTNDAFASVLPGSVKIVKLDGDRALLTSQTADNPTAAVLPDQLAYVLYTSGSTGTPKGVAVTHANAVHYSRAVSRVLADIPASASGDGFAALSGLHFGVASTLAADLGNTSLLPSLMSGGTLHMLTKDATTEPAKFEAYVAANPLDVLKITPNHLSALTSGKTGSALAPLLPAKWVVVGGEALRPDVARAILGANKSRLLNHYGPTETTVGVCTFEVTNASLAEAQAMGAQSLPLGRPLANTRTYIVDGHNNELPVGIPGELLLGGAGVANGYLRRDDLTAERFVQFAGDRVYRTGDRVRRLPNGTIEFLGRADDQVKIRGHRVELGDVEHAIRSHPGVAQAVVAMRSDANNEPMLVAYAVPHTEGYAVSHSDRPTVQRLTEWVSAELPAYMVPGAIVLLEALPLTANGKVDRAKLPSPDDTASAEAEYVAPRTETETQLAAIWMDVLKKERVGITDNFLSLGGHSLMAIRVLGKISKAFGVRLPLRVLFETPTIEGLAVLIESERKTSAPISSGIGASSRDKYRINQSSSAESNKTGGES